MILIAQRTSTSHICSFGEIFCDAFACSMMEPSKDIHGRGRGVRVGANQYGLVLDVSTDSPVNRHYAKRFGDEFHHGMIALAHTHPMVYLMMGNYPTDLADNILVGMTHDKRSLNESQGAYEMLYPLISDALINGEHVMIDVRDEVL